MRTPQARAAVARLNSGLTCRHCEAQNIAGLGVPSGTELLGHMWVWWDDESGTREYRGYWPNADGVDDPAMLEDPPRLSEFLKQQGVYGEIRRDRAAQVLTEHFPNQIFRRSWNVSERKLTALAYKSFVQKRLSHRQIGRYGFQVSGCDNSVSWAVKCINETVGDSFTIPPFSPPKAATAATVIFGKTCPNKQEGR